jgi:ribose/xylose/arabinose/galactoside ABC-type transport system permease subunit
VSRVDHAITECVPLGNTLELVPQIVPLALVGMEAVISTKITLSVPKIVIVITMACVILLGKWPIFVKIV